jgi:DNA-binding beta-propeller fold protein YncE
MESISNAFETHTGFICYSQLSKTVEATNGHGLLFCNEQCLEQYNSNHGLYLPLIADEVIDYIMMPLVDIKVLHYLNCADSKWRKKIEEYIKKSVPMFKFVAKFGSNGNGHFDYPYSIATDKQGNIYVSDCFNHRIQIFGCNGQWMNSIGSNGSGNGQFYYSTGITFN